MIKKSICIGGAALLVLALMFGRDTCSYMRTSLGWMKDTVRDSVPVEFQLQRARKMIKDLKPEIRHNMHLIFKEEVEVERLEEQIQNLEQQIEKDREEITRLSTALHDGHDTNYVYVKSRRYTATDVKAKLAHRFERFKTSESTLDNLKKVSAARKRGLDAARRKLEEMVAQKQSLIVNVENLEARQKMVAVAQTASDFNFDDSHLARTKGLITDIESRIRIDEKLVNADIDFGFGDEVVSEEVDTDELLDEVAEYLGSKTPQAEALVDAS